MKPLPAAKSSDQKTSVDKHVENRISSARRRAFRLLRDGLSYRLSSEVKSYVYIENDSPPHFNAYGCHGMKLCAKDVIYY
jgi:hypothetical protein